MVLNDLYHNVTNLLFILYIYFVSTIFSYFKWKKYFHFYAIDLSATRNILKKILSVH